jgi:hypothetical protein
MANAKLSDSSGRRSFEQCSEAECSMRRALAVRSNALLAAGACSISACLYCSLPRPFESEGQSKSIARLAFIIQIVDRKTRSNQGFKYLMTFPRSEFERELSPAKTLSLVKRSA